MQGDLILSALLAAFGKSAAGALGRFARRFAGEKIGLAVEREQSLTSQAVRFARELVDSGTLSDELFDALQGLSPDYADVIQRARLAWQADQEEQARAKGPSRSTVTDGLASAATAKDADQWLDDLDAALDEAALPLPAPPREWMDAAALVPNFKPSHLARLRNGPVLAGEPPHAAVAGTEDALVTMARFVEQESAGIWVLKRDARTEAIAGMLARGTLARGIEVARRLDARDRHRLYHELLDEVMHHVRIQVTLDEPEERLNAIQVIGEWFQRAGRLVVDLDRLSVLREARNKIDPLRKLVGRHFRGRRDELATLASNEGFGPEHQRVLALTGIGGVGKSALLGRYVLARVESVPPQPVVYLDFDRSEIDPASPRTLIERIARHLGLLSAGMLSRHSSQGFYQLEAMSAGDAFSSTEQLADWLPAGGSDEAMLSALNQRLGAEDFVLIFDTFEVVCTRGPEVLDRFTAFLRLVLRTMPHVRLVLSGRGRIALPLDMHPMPLHDLDPESADEVLKSHGVAEAALRTRIVEVMGRSPLVLRLAGQGVRSGKLDGNDINRFDAEARGTKVQGLLYTRVLGHIRDPEVERLAHPGMVVRRVTAEVIRDVLADLCRIDPGHAESLFARLPDQIELFEPASEPRPGGDPLADPGALRHRQDLREALLEVMLDDPRWRDVVPTIHRRAADHYATQPGLVARAERLYHLLMLDIDPEALDRDSPWDERMQPLLSRSWSEPFPARARAWLGLRLGLDWRDGDADLSLVDWEIRTARVAQERLRAHDADGALQALRQRPERTAASPLTPIEAEALTALGRRAEAMAVLETSLDDRASASAGHELRLRLLAADAAADLARHDSAIAHAQRAAELAGAAHDVPGRLRALEIQARVSASSEDIRRLERAFVETSELDLRSDEQAAVRIVRTIGGHSNAVLRKAASTFGDLPKQDLLTNDLRTWSTLFETVRARPDSARLLTSFASRIGLGAQEDDPVRMATEMMRHGRRGEAIDTFLTAFGDDPSIVSGSAATFKVLQ